MSVYVGDLSTTGNSNLQLGDHIDLLDSHELKVALLGQHLYKQKVITNTQSQSANHS